VYAVGVGAAAGCDLFSRHTEVVGDLPQGLTAIQNNNHRPGRRRYGPATVSDIRNLPIFRS